MSRTIVTRSTRPTVGPLADGPAFSRNDVADGYQTQFLKLMPIQVISAYMTIDGLLYLRYVAKLSNRRQIGLDEAVIRLIGSILIPIYTLIALIILNR